MNRVLARLAIVVMLCAAPLFAQDHHHHGPETMPVGEQLGSVHFPVSCPSVQKPFERGVALLHSFWYEEAQKQFESVTKQDPNCAMAHWGVAMSYFHQLWDRPDRSVVERGAAEMARARALDVKTDRERQYIGALSAFYDPTVSDHVARADAYAAKMKALYAAHPEDAEAGAFYALSLLTSEHPGDTSLQHQRAALAVLQPLFAKNPGHPGLAHYIIHTCDTPALAQQGLAAAREYAKIAPASPHAVHMPSHIFARLGLWQEDIASNEASVRATERATANGQGGAGHQLHAKDFLVYAYLQTGQEAKAKNIVDGTSDLMHRLASLNEEHDEMLGMSNFYTSEYSAIYALETRDWQRAASLPVPTGQPGIGTLLTYWARTIGSARLGNAEQARDNATSYEKAVAAMKSGPMAYMVEEVEVPSNEVRAWQAYAEKRTDDALQLLRKAADQQDKRGQGEVDIPAREMLADMLMNTGHEEQALVEYQAALKLSPNRFNGLYNGARAAEAAKRPQVAAQLYRTLMQMTNDGANSGRPELAHAKEYLAKAQVASR
jgi:tetratricopeptide (TPR) repeat protein